MSEPLRDENWYAELAEVNADVSRQARALLPHLDDDDFMGLDVCAKWNEFDEKYYVASIKDSATGKSLWPNRRPMGF